jgi:hypothetical protein
MRTTLTSLTVFAALAAAAPQAGAFTSTYRVVSVTHSSSSRKNDPPYYFGTSTARWNLAPPTSKAPNLVPVTIAGPVAYGGGTINVRGVFTAEARSNRGKPPCTLTAPTGSKKYPAVAPGPFQLVVGPDPKSRNRVQVVHGIVGNVHASLSNPYFGSECSTSITGEPDSDRTRVKSVPKSTFRQKTVVIRYAGSTNDSGISYRWSTTFTLKRIKFKP